MHTSQVLKAMGNVLTPAKNLVLLPVHNLVAALQHPSRKQWCTEHTLADLNELLERGVDNLRPIDPNAAVRARHKRKAAADLEAQAAAERAAREEAAERIADLPNTLPTLVVRRLGEETG